MQGLTIDEVDGETSSDAELGSVAELLTAIYSEWAPDDPAVDIDWARAALYTGNEIVWKRRMLAKLGGRPVGLATVELDLTDDNPHIAELYVEIHPDLYRRGIGTSLVRHAVAMARAEGRTSLLAVGPRTDASGAFWDRLSVPEVGTDRMSRVSIADIDVELMDRWRTRSAAQGEGYALHSWVNPCPDEYLGLYVATMQGMNDAPMDDLKMAPPQFDEAWVRARERSMEQRAGVMRVIAAVSPEGDPAGMTEINVWDHKPWFILQQGTTTLAPHRSRGLGRWLKAEMYHQIVRHHPRAKIIETGNADSNQAMLSINDEMGFGLHVQHTVRQADLDVVEAALARPG